MIGNRGTRLARWPVRPGGEGRWAGTRERVASASPVVTGVLKKLGHELGSSAGAAAARLEQTSGLRGGSSQRLQL